MLIPLSPMHVAEAVPTAPSDAAANPAANPVTTAPRSRPLARLSLETVSVLYSPIIGPPLEIISPPLEIVVSGRQTVPASLQGTPLWSTPAGSQNLVEQHPDHDPLRPLQPERSCSASRIRCRRQRWRRMHRRRDVQRRTRGAFSSAGTPDSAILYYAGTNSTSESTTASSRLGAVTTPTNRPPSFHTLARMVSPGNTTPANRAP